MKNLLVTFSVAGLLFLAGCKDNETVSPPPQGKVKVSGTVYADLDWVVDGNEKVTDKKVRLLLYIGEELVRTLETTTNSNGEYSFEFDLSNQVGWVNLNLVDFKAMVKKNSTTTEEEIFYGDNFWYALDLYPLVKGGEYIRDLYYND